MTSQTVLLVDDNATTRKLVRFALESKGYRVVEAEDGRTAIGIMSTQTPDLVLQDLMLPDIDGFELVGQLRACPGGTTVPILAFSGLLSHGEEARVSAFGFDDLIVKPIEPSRLLPFVAAHLSKPMPSAQAFGAGLSVVVADDNPVLLKLTMLQLAHAGFHVEAATTGVGAVELARKIKAKALVVDMLMPDLDGFGVCSEARRIPELANVPILLVTSLYVDEAERELAQSVGATDLVARTSDPQNIANTLYACLQQPGCTRIPSATAAEEISRERIRRTLLQLECQVALNAGTNQRCAALTAELSVLSAASEALARHGDIPGALDTVLSSCFDAAGVSVGSLYLMNEDGSLRVRGSPGYAGCSPFLLETFFGFPTVLQDIVRSGKTTVIPSDALSPAICAAILAESTATSLVIAPMLYRERPLGALVMLSKDRKLELSELPSFAQGVANQIAQAIALSQVFENMAKLEARHRAVLDNATAGIFTLSTNGRFIDVNRTGELLLGQSRTAVYNQRLLDFIGPEDRDYVQLKLQRLGSEARVELGDIAFMPCNGSQLTLSLTASATEAPAEALVLVIATDVTERNRLRQQAMLNDKLATTGMLAAGIVHEINNPMTCVIANLAFAQELLNVESDSACSARDSELREFLAESCDGVQRIRSIVGNLNGFARVDGNDVAELQIHNVLDRAIAMTSHELKYRARVEKNYAGDLPKIVGSPGKLHQVFVNLMVNAAHAMPTGAHDNCLRLTTCKTPTGICVEISDTGHGIPQHLLNKIFEPFFTTKASGSGTGLGLAISYEIVRNHRGTMRVQSEVGKGTTFSVELPFDTQIRHPETEPAVLCAQQRRPARLLLVDDDPKVLTAIERMLSSVHEVTTAASAQAALQIYTESPSFDLVLADLQMPGMSGLELYHQLSELHPETADRFVFLSGGVFDERFLASLNRLSVLRLEKPCTAPELLDAVDLTLLRLQRSSKA